MKVFFTKKKGIFISILAVFLAITVFVFAKTAPVMQLKILISNYYNDKITLYKQQNATLENVDVAFIGDRMDTDIIAGIESNMDTVLVLSGVTAKEDISLFPYRPKYVLNGVGDLLK